MLEHWTQRQAAGKVPLQFKKAPKAIRPNKRASKESDADADIEPGEEAEEGLQEDGDSHAWGGGSSQGGGDSSYSTEQARLGQNLGNAAENLSGVGSPQKNGDRRY